LKTEDTRQSDFERTDWPEGVEPISYASIGRLGVGRDNQLYCDGMASRSNFAGD
jgi:hypothetical protein